MYTMCTCIKQVLGCSHHWDCPSAARTAEMVSTLGCCPATSVEVGVRRVVDWFTQYYGYKR